MQKEGEVFCLHTALKLGNIEKMLYAADISQLHVFLAVTASSLLKDTWCVYSQVKLTSNICSRLGIIFDITICTNVTHPFIKFLFFEKAGKFLVLVAIIPAF